MTNTTDVTGTMSWWIQTKNGQTYSGTDSQSLYDAFRLIAKNKQIIGQMILKGHGYDGGVTAGLFSDTHLIKIIEHRIKVTGHRDPMMTGTPLAEDVTGILKQITDSTTNIYLRACTSSGAAESLLILLPGTHVEGCVAPALSISFT